MKPFQAAVLIGFAFLALAAVFIFALYSGGKNTNVGVVSVWGPLPQSTVDDVLAAVRMADHGFDGVTYKQFPADTFMTTLVQAIAAGTGPDVVIFPADSIIKNGNKLVPIPYATLSRRTFTDTYVQAGEAFLTNDGALGLPFVLDPLVEYWNRSVYATGGVARPPTYWDEFTDAAPHLSKSSSAGTLSESAVALGGWGNISHAKEVLVGIFIGLGAPIITHDTTGVLQVVLGMQDARTGSATTPSASALRFYTDFADPAKTVYSWNPSLPNDQKAFLAGTLATYLGYASEAATLRDANPNLNFDISAFPSVRGAAPAVPARLYAVSIPRGAKNSVGATKVAIAMTAAGAETALTTATGLPSVRLDALAPAAADPYAAIFRQAALNSFVFLDPDPVQSDAIFAHMVEAVTSGKLAPAQAIQNAQGDLQAILKW